MDKCVNRRADCCLADRQCMLLRLLLLCTCLICLFVFLFSACACLFHVFRIVDYIHQHLHVFKTIQMALDVHCNNDCQPSQFSPVRWFSVCLYFFRFSVRLYFFDFPRFSFVCGCFLEQFISFYFAVCIVEQPISSFVE